MQYILYTTLRCPVCRYHYKVEKQGTCNRLLGRAPDSWSKGCEFEARQERRENFLLQSQLCVLTLIWCPFQPRVTAVARKRPRSFCKKCRWQVTRKHAYTLTQRIRSGLTMPLSRHSVRTYQEMSSHATRQGTLSHSHLSSLSHCGLILAYKVELVWPKEWNRCF